MAEESRALTSGKMKEKNYTSDVFLGGPKFPVPLSLNWRIGHAIAYLIGGTTFLAGSLQYFPQAPNYALGGWLFTVGSASFLLADLNEWWLNNRVGCAFDADYRSDYEDQVAKYFGSRESVVGSYLRMENGLNFAFSATGSTLYLIGSILFIPSTNQIVMGTIVFIWGSLIIFLSQLWKVIRQGLGMERVFKFANYADDLPALGVDTFAGLGGLSYLIGSVYFLPEYDTSDAVTIKAATWFTLGGAFFTLSGVFIVYRYFCTLNYAH